MPLDLAVHDPGCPWETGACSCAPRCFTDPAEALSAHQGDSRRLQVRGIVPPAPKFTEPVEFSRSQARRHRAAISY
jgi:hypothetical protein